MKLQYVFKFCPVCKTELHNTAGNIVVCPNNDFTYYLNPCPCNAVLLKNNNGDIILVKRKYEPKQGYWDFPGGFIDANENLEESAIREIKEELGILITNIQYFRSYNDTYHYKNIQYATIGFVVTASMQNQTITPADDVTEVKFFKEKEIPYDQLAFDSVKKALQEYIALK